MQIIDTIMFNNELDLLDLRLNILDSVVDKFVIVEANKTFSGLDKPRTLAKNLERYVKFFDKIIYIDVELTEPNAWARESQQRNAISFGLEKANISQDDLILMSDADEIPNPDFFHVISKIPPNNFPVVLSQKMYYGHLNSFCYTDPNWLGTIVIPFGQISKRGFTFQSLRDARGKVSTFMNGGWHFSWMGGKEKVIDKIKSYSHQEYNTGWHTDIERISHALDSNQDVLGRPEFKYELQNVTTENGYPQYLVDNLDKFKHLILN